MTSRKFDAVIQWFSRAAFVAGIALVYLAITPMGQGHLALLGAATIGASFMIRWFKADPRAFAVGLAIALVTGGVVDRVTKPSPTNYPMETAMASASATSGFQSGSAPVGSPSTPASPATTYPTEFTDCISYFDRFPNRFVFEDLQTCRRDPAVWLAQQPPASKLEKKLVGLGASARDSGLVFTLMWATKTWPTNNIHAWISVKNTTKKRVVLRARDQYVWAEGERFRAVGMAIDQHALRPCTIPAPSMTAPPPSLDTGSSKLAVGAKERRHFVIFYDLEKDPYGYEFHARSGSIGVLGTVMYERQPDCLKYPTHVSTAPTYSPLPQTSTTAPRVIPSATAKPTASNLTSP